MYTCILELNKSVIIMCLLNKYITNNMQYYVKDFFSIDLNIVLAGLN